MSSVEFRVQEVRALVSLVKWLQFLGGESLPLVVCGRLDPIVVYPDAAVGVPDGQVDGQVVLERVVAVEVELGQRCVGGVELDFVGAQYEPADENDDPDDDEDGAEDLAHAGAEAVDEAAEGVAAEAPAVAGAVVGLGRRRYGRAVVGSVEMGLLGVSHCNS